MIDIVLMVVALIAFLVGWRKGLVSAIGGLVALVGAVWTARTYAAHLAEIFAGWWSEMDEKVLYIIAFALVFLVVNLVISLLAHLLESLLKALFLGWVNRLFGALLSVV
ncbi:MAG: CvpA family protein, partial [Bacteroidales bacterium]|nr:CvpA family protein [Bacteroidales bacterium]